MLFSSRHQYSPLQEELHLEKNDVVKQSIVRKTTLLNVFSQGCVALLIALSGFLLGLQVNGKCDAAAEQKWSTDLPTLKRYNTQFNGSFEFHNRYRGRPGPEIDHEWARFTEHPLIDGTASLIAVDKEDIGRANKTAEVDWFNSTVQYGEVNGGGYMATLELFHQLHCLNMLRKAVHHDYYEDMRPMSNGSYSYIMRTHLDHCVEILRQVINCHADTGLITFHWVQGNPVPYPDFNTWHQCKDPEEVLAWAKAREAPVVLNLEKKMSPNVVEMPNPP